MKRLLDILVSFIGLVLVSPVLVVAAILVKLDSRGPVFFRHARIGRNFKKIHVTKLRSMRTGARGSALTSREDPRITSVGKFLRKTKIDELPQLWDVLVGDMSLVGPRPQSPQYVEEYREEYSELLKVRPGITDPSSIAYRSETEILGSVSDPERYYIEAILPHKLRISREYMEKATVWTDCRIMFETLAACFRPIGHADEPHPQPKLKPKAEILVRVLADILTLNAALFAAYVLRAAVLRTTGGPYHNGAYENIVSPYLHSAWLLTSAAVITFFAMGFYTKGRAYASRYKILVVVQASALAFLAFGFISYFVPFVMVVPRSVLLTSWELATAVLIASRLWASIWAWVVMSEAPAVERARASAQPKHVLLIGGAGYVGSALLPQLLENGYKVRLMDMFLYGSESIADCRNHPNLEIVKADFRQVDVLVRAMRNVESVVHLGGIVGDPACALDEELTMEVNLLATRMIAEVAKGHGIQRFVFASSCSVYGASDLQLDERSKLNPVSLFARSKLACEDVLLSLKDKNFAPVILRFGTVYGLSGRTRFDLAVNLLTAKAITQGVIPVYGGDQSRAFLHVHDAALAVFRALEAPPQALSDTVFNVGSNAQNYTFGEVGRMIQQLVPSADLQFMEERDRYNYRVKFDRIQRSLRFTPEWTLQQGIRQVIHAIESGAVLDHNDPRFSNVKFLSEEIGTEKLRRDDQAWAWQVLQPSRAQTAVGGQA